MTSSVASIVIGILVSGGVAAGQEPQRQQQEQSDKQDGSRTELIEQAEAAKAASLTPARPGKAEAYVSRIADAFLGGQMHWHTFFQNAYSGGGFTLGAGYMRFVSPTNTL